MTPGWPVPRRRGEERRAREREGGTGEGGGQEANSRSPVNRRDVKNAQSSEDRGALEYKSDHPQATPDVFLIVRPRNKEPYVGLELES